MKDINIEHLNNDLNIKNRGNILSKQNNALSQILNDVINWSIDAGLKYILPNSIENEVIKIKNDILNGNVTKKIINTISSVINFGKENLNNEKKEILNIEDIKNLLKSPDTIKLISNTIEEILNNEKFNNVDKKIKNINNKQIIEKNVEENLNSQLENQIKSINKIENYKNEWYKNYENKDFEKMNKVYRNIKKELIKIIPLDNIIKETRKIENLNELIKSKGGDFNITKEELELANKLI